MSAIFDLEQQMLECWNVTKDIDLVTRYLVDNSGGYTDDDVMNKYFAIKDLYELKFEQMWDTFEQVCKEYHSK
jgi:superfamily I DNA and RNA helicase